MKKRKSIAFCIHGNQQLDFYAYANHLSLVLATNKHYDVGLITVRGVRVAQARNLIVEEVEKMKPDYVFFLDTDHIVQDNALDLLVQDLEEENFDCISGLIHKRLSDLTAVGYKIEEDGSFLKLFFSEELDRTYLADICAFGCTLMKAELFNSISKPIFKDTNEKTKSGEDHNFRSDINFCRALHKQDKQVGIDTRVKVGHISEPLIVFPQNAATLQQLKKTGDLLRPEGYSGLAREW